MPEISEFDQEFTTEGSAGVETEKLEALIQQNLSPEEQNFMEQAKPIVAQFMGLLQKATGQNPEDLEDVVCNKCECQTFEPVMLFKKLSAVLSPTGKETLVPLQVYKCTDCGHINSGFLPKSHPDKSE